MHLKLAEMVGEVDADKVANSLTKPQLREWMAYALLQGWFPQVDEAKENGMTPEQLLARLQGGN